MKLKTCWNALSADYIDQHVRNDNNVERKVFNWYMGSYINNENPVTYILHLSFYNVTV